MSKKFTLIEMLVVIAIIGILAAMLSGPLMRARQSSLAASCKNLLRGYGTATTMYNNDWNMWMPDVRTYLRQSSGFPAYFGGSKTAADIVRCPGDGTTQGLGRLKHYADAEDNDLQTSIGAVSAILSDSQSATAAGPTPMYFQWARTLCKITLPGKAISWSDYQATDTDHTDLTRPPILPTAQGINTSAALGNYVFRHFGAANGVFLDNHVGAVRIKNATANDGHDLAEPLWWRPGNTEYPFGPRQAGGPGGTGTSDPQNMNQSLEF